MYEWDEKKAAGNLAKHSVAFEAIYDFDWVSAVEVEDDRFNYGEQRLVAIGWLRGALHTVTFTWRGDMMRIISLRKADKRDQKYYAKAKEKT
ncbi:MAG: BrnT family toxin [Rhodomicrobium sp.]